MKRSEGLGGKHQMASMFGQVKRVGQLNDSWNHQFLKSSRRQSQYCYQFLQELGKKLSFRKPEDWYKLDLNLLSPKQRSILQLLLSSADKSPSKLLISLHPMHKWFDWHFKFINMPNGFWEVKENQKSFLQWLGIKLGFTTMEDWYKICARDIRSGGGGPLLEKFGQSPSKLLESVYFDHPWLIWKFEFPLKGLWSSKENQKLFMSWLGNLLGFATLEDWYSITLKDFHQNRGIGLLEEYNNSLPKLIMAMFPNHQWSISKFLKEPRQFSNWSAKKYADLLGEQLQFKELDSWYNVTRKQMVFHGGKRFLLRKYGNCPWKLVMSAYPEHKWILARFSGGIILNQPDRVELIHWLAQELQIKHPEEWFRVSWSQISQKVSPRFFKKYPLEQVLQEAYPNISWNIPKLQSKRFGAIKASQRMLVKIVQEIFVDSELIECHQYSSPITGRKIELDIYLSKEELAFEYQGEQHYYDVYALGNLWIQKQRDKFKREICKEEGIILIEVPYWWDFKKASLIATIWEQAPQFVSWKGDGDCIPTRPPKGFPKGLVPELMHGEEWDGTEDLQGWWMSEKMDGIRAYWNGTKLISKQAKDIICPPWFSDSLPKGLQLDGELWMGRKTFEKTLAAISSAQNQYWKDMRYMVFDVVTPNEQYEIRMEKLQQLKLPPFARVIEIKLCKGSEDLIKELHSITSAGGEGIVVTKAQSLYLSERTRNRLKVKFPDANWTVAHNSRSFFTHLKENFGCQSLEDFYRISVEDICREGGRGLICHMYHGSLAATLKSIYPDHKWLEWKFAHPVSSGFWDKLENRAAFMSSLRKELGIERMEDWYKISARDIQERGGVTLLAKYGDSPRKLIMSTFPQHNWLKNGFPTKPWNLMPRSFWDREENQKIFLDWLGIQLGFTSMEDWYNLTRRDILKTRCSTLLFKYRGSLSKLVMSIYPNHNWKIWKFSVPKGFWNQKHNQKKFMDWLGEDIGINQTEDWYGVRVKDIHARKGNALLAKYSGLPYKLIVNIYPEHAWEIWKFSTFQGTLDELLPFQKLELILWLTKELKIRSLDQWYHTKWTEVRKKASLRLNEQLHLQQTLQEAYPQHEWHLEKLWSFTE